MIIDFNSRKIIIANPENNIIANPSEAYMFLKEGISIHNKVFNKINDSESLVEYKNWKIQFPVLDFQIPSKIIPFFFGLNKFDVNKYPYMISPKGAKYDFVYLTGHYLLLDSIITKNGLVIYDYKKSYEESDPLVSSDDKDDIKKYLEQIDY